MSLYLGDKKIAGLADGIQVIGEIKYIPCTSNYVPSGCLPCDGAEYDKSQFADLWNNYLVVNPQTQTLYAWGGNSFYTKSSTPAINDSIYNSDGTINESYVVGSVADDNSYITLSSLTSTFAAGRPDEDASIGEEAGEVLSRVPEDDVSITESNSLLSTCTYAEYAADITASGQCGKFGVDTSTNKFKVPTLPNRLITGVEDTAGVRGTGQGMTITNGTTEYSLFAGGAYSGQDRQGLLCGGTYKSDNLPITSTESVIPGGYIVGLSADSSKSGIIAEPQVQSIAARAFVVVANGQINQSQMDWSAWAAGLQGKANNSLENVTDAGKLAGIDWLMPDYSAGVTCAAGTVHTATVPGWVMFKTTGIPQSQAIKINGVEFALGSKGNYGTCYDTLQEFIPVSAGDTFYLDSLSTPTIIFYPCKGASNASDDDSGGGVV